MRNATDFLIDYARDHRDRRNIASHFVGVPLVIFAVAALLARARFGIGGQEISMAWVAVAVLALGYLARSGTRRGGRAGCVPGQPWRLCRAHRILRRTRRVSSQLSAWGSSHCGWDGNDSRARPWVDPGRSAVRIDTG